MASKNKRYLLTIGEIGDDGILKLIPEVLDKLDPKTIENTERDVKNISLISKESLDDYLKNQNLTLSSSTSSVIANQASSRSVREISSTPVSTGLGRGVNFKSNSSILVYPANMSDSQDRIQFSIWEYKNRSLLRDNVSDPERVGQSAAIRVENLDLSVQKPGKEFDNYKAVEKKPYVYLPITKISDTNSADWTEDRLNTLQMQLARISMSFMQGEGGGSGMDQTKQLIDWARGTEFGSMALTYLAGQAIGVGGLLTRTTGGIFNPNLELLFQSPQLRQFAFSFSMFSKNNEEATKIKSIIKFFKQNMAPRTASDSNIFLNSPYVFRIKYLSGNPGNKLAENTPDHPSIGKIKMCALQSCTTDYTPLGSYTTFNDTDNNGTPISTMVMYNLTLNFKELHPIYDVDYNDNHPIGF
jgi:hypothetical protein